MATKKKTIHVKPEYGEQRQVKKSDDFVSLYVNHAQFGYTRWDFQIMLGQVELSRDLDYNHVKEQSVLTMTPEYAKAFLADFARVLMEYEKKHGTIILRPDIGKPEKQDNKKDEQT